MRIVIPGGTGHLGSLLARHFHEQGHAVSTITRFPKPHAWEAIHWDAETLGPWAATLDGADVVINLAANPKRKATEQSRILTSNLVASAIRQCEHPPALWLNAATADTSTEESAGRQLTRKVTLRMAPVMSPDSGSVFDKLLCLVRIGLGGTSGSGEQHVSWIHDVDLIRALEFLFERGDIAGDINLTSPNPIPNRQFMCCLRRAWCTSYIGVPSPGWLLEQFLKSNRVVPRRLLDSGFAFHFPEWRGAAENLVDRWRSRREENSNRW